MKPVALHGINAARAISCLLIVFYHITQYLEANGLPIWYPLKTPGLHLFIVISGFMLVYTTRENDTGGRFLLKRLARIVPLYWTLTLCVILMASWRGWLFPGTDLSLHGIASSLFFVPSENFVGHIHPILFTGWTLNYIVLSYALFAVAMFAPFKYRPYVAVALLVAFMMMASQTPDPVMRRFWTDPFLLELIAGMAAAMLIKKASVLQWASRYSMWPLIIISGIVLLVASAWPMTEVERALSCGLSAGVFVFALALRDVQRHAAKEGPLQPVARLSYSIYLVHPLVIPLVGLVIAGRLGWPELEIFAIVVASFAITIVVSSFTYSVIEERAAAWVNRRIKGRRPATRQRISEDAIKPAAGISLKDG